MKEIPIQLLTALKRPGRSTCFLVKIVDNEGNVHGFTTLDAVVNFDDGIHAVSYSPNDEMRPQNIQSSSEMTVDNTELLG